ncbi:hypothetical protein CEXT_384621 [Caerostris extrusa]|uniref:Uncharacterized protein n=1 Tax=Caerostris extrusa TaxID=172846 RepID=A0AAV4MLF5_CAEEX|nr:hypothetical protein CEXT_384621 [Caerostris extrusa]
MQMRDMDPDNPPDQSYLWDVRGGDFHFPRNTVSFSLLPNPLPQTKKKRRKEKEQKKENGRSHKSEETRIHFIHCIYLLFPQQWR